MNIYKQAPAYVTLVNCSLFDECGSWKAIIVTEQIIPVLLFFKNKNKKIAHFLGHPIPKSDRLTLYETENTYQNYHFLDKKRFSKFLQG